jgi:hypothetical protein
MFTTKFSKTGRQHPLARKFAEGGLVDRSPLDPDDRRRYRKATKEEEEEMGGPTSPLERFMIAITGKTYKKESLSPKRETLPVAGLGPRG